MPLRLKLRKHQDNKNHRLKFDITKLQDPNVNSLFKAHIGGRFASLLTTNQDAQGLTTEFTETITKAAQDFTGKERRLNRPWVTQEALNACDERRRLKTLITRSEEDREM